MTNGKLRRQLFVAASAIGCGWMSGSLPAQPAHAQASVGYSDGTTTVRIDTEAQALLDKMKAAYKAADFYGSDIEYQTVGTPEPQQVVAKLLWQKPNKLSLQYTNATGSTRLVSDGQLLTLTNPRAVGQYIQLKAPAGKAALTETFKKLGLEKSHLYSLLMGQDILRPYGSSLQSISLKKVNAKTANGPQVAKDRVAIVVQFQRRNDKGTAILVVDTATSLLRSVKISKTVNGEPVTVTEVYNNRRLSPAEGDSFDFVPAQGERQVAEFTLPRYDPRLVVGAAPLQFTAKDTEGKPINLDDYKGKVLLLDFWASWCPPCRDEAPAVVKTYRDYNASGFEIVGINLDDDRQRMKNFMGSVGMTWRQQYDGKAWSNAVSKVYGVSFIPFTVLIGRDGKIAAVGARGANLYREVGQAVAKKAP